MDKFDLVIKNGKVFTSGDEYSADMGKLLQLQKPLKMVKK